VSSGRDEVLARIRTALADGPGPADAQAGPAVLAGPEGHEGAGFRRHGELSGAELTGLLASRLASYRAQVRHATAQSLAAEVSAALERRGEVLQRRGAVRVVVPPGLHLALPAFAEVCVDDGLTAAELDRFDAVVTRCAVAIAETGTIILDGSAGQGRRAVTLVPDYHLCIVDSGQIVHLVPEAIAALAGLAGRPLTWISGPSATSDIELERVEGVHGPRTLEVILVADD
jgi:L-lactate dehydrogenase complex protein LldG